MGVPGTFRIDRDIETFAAPLTLGQLRDACGAAMQEGIPSSARVVQVATSALHSRIQLELETEWRRTSMTGDAGTVGG